MKLFENSLPTDMIRIKATPELAEKFSARDGYVNTTIAEFRDFLDETNADVDDYEITQDGDVIYDKYALIYDVEVE